MGAKTWMLVYADSSAVDALGARPQLDRKATQQLANTLFPGETLKPLEDGDLSNPCPLNCHTGRATIRPLMTMKTRTPTPSRFIHWTSVKPPCVTCLVSSSKAISIPRCWNRNQFRWSDTSVRDRGGDSGAKVRLLFKRHARTPAPVCPHLRPPPDCRRCAASAGSSIQRPGH